ncbi:MAG: DUF1028 domain-containing protein [Actinobacteria bacterium]|nr:DUF1028 domain-containing protein [Actinomycetota bacterium]
MTFSIAAWDPNAQPTPEWGVAVASKFLAVGAAVPYARAGAGAVATQALANLAYGNDGLERLQSGSSAEETVGALTSADSDRAERQLGIVDAKGGAATFTGEKCFDWAGGVTGDGYCCQGNILTGPDVVERMAEAFEETEGELAVRLLSALRAGDAAGGDKRGRQSAALLIVRENGGYGGGTDRTVDLRVDDHDRPLPELIRIFDLHSLFFARPDQLEFTTIDAPLGAELRGALQTLGYEPGRSSEPYDDGLRRALYAYCGTENLEERWTDDAAIERRVLEYLRDQTGARAE